MVTIKFNNKTIKAKDSEVKVNHYIYSYPYSVGNKVIKEEYELYIKGELKGIFYENPAPSVKEEIIYD